MSEIKVNEWRGHNPTVTVSRTFENEDSTLSIATYGESPVRMSFDEKGLLDLIKKLEWALNTKVRP